jgi:iron complex outermembrane receptor protein
MRMLQRACWYLLILTAAAGTARPECVEIGVRDPAGLPVAGATLRAASGRTARTNDAGVAQLCGLGAGRQRVTVEAAGFSLLAITLEAPGSDTVTLALGARVEVPVVVTGTTEPQQLNEVERSITVIPVESAAAPGSWLTDLLKSDASVDVRERGVDGTQADVSIRGGGYGQTLVLVNGHRVNDPQSGHHNLDLPLPLESVSRMEVLRGSGSTLYGSDAVAGAVNVITRRPETAELRLGGGLGDFGWNRESATGAFRLGRWGQHVGVARDFSTGFREGRDFRNTAVAAETFLDQDWGSTSVLFAYNDRPFGANGFYGDYPSWEKTGTHLLAATQTVGRHRVQFSYRRHRDQYILYRYQPQIFQNLHTAGEWDGSYTYRREVRTWLDFTGGAAGLSEAIDSTNLGQHRRERGSAFFVWQARPAPRVTLTAGLREEAYRKWRVVSSPTASAGVRLGKGFKARGSVGHGFRAPNYTDLYYHDPSNLGNPNLRPESAWTYEAGLDWWGPGGMSVGATWFERREHDSIDFVRPAGAAIWQAQNFQRLNFHGGEVDWRERLRQGEVGISYTILRASQDLLPGVASRYVFNFPRSSLAATTRWTLGRHVLVRTRVGAFNRSWHGTKGLWDLTVGGQSRRVQPFIQVTNLLNTYYEAFPGLAQPGRWIRGGVQISLLPGR